jgi:hypothetical protein
MIDWAVGLLAFCARRWLMNEASAKPAAMRKNNARRFFDEHSTFGNFTALDCVHPSVQGQLPEYWHGYLNLSAGLDFETKPFAKTSLEEVRRGELSKRSYVCKPINIGSNTDPYEPI